MEEKSVNQNGTSFDVYEDLSKAKRTSFGIYESALASILFIIYNIVFLTLYRRLPLYMRQNQWVSYLASFLIEFLFALVAITVAKARKIDVKKATCTDKKFNGRLVWLGFVIAFCSLFFFSSLTNVFLEFLGLLGYESIMGSMDITYFWQYLIYVIVSCLTPAICEEMLFRGTILSGLKKYGFKIAVIVSSIIFTLMHGNAEQTIHQFVVGFIVGTIFYKTGNLWIGVIVHFFNNFISITQYYLLSLIASDSLEVTEEVTNISQTNAWLSLLFSLIFALILAYFGVCVMKKLIKKVEAENAKINANEENLAQITVDGQTMATEMVIENKTESGESENSLEQESKNVVAKETESLPISVIVMFCLSGAYMICDWVSALLLGFGL